MVKSDEKKPELPVSKMFSELSAGGELTTVEVLKGMAVSDKNLSMITQHKDSSVLTVLGVLIAYAERKEYEPLVFVLKALLREYRENQCSLKGWRAEQMFRGIVADLERMKKEEDVGERLGVKRSKR